MILLGIYYLACVIKCRKLALYVHRVQTTETHVQGLATSLGNQGGAVSCCASAEL